MKTIAQDRPQELRLRMIRVVQRLKLFRGIPLAQYRGDGIVYFRVRRHVGLFGRVQP